MMFWSRRRLLIIVLSFSSWKSAVGSRQWLVSGKSPIKKQLANRIPRVFAFIQSKVYYSPTVCLYPLSSAHFPPPIAHCPLSTGHYSLPNTHYLIINRYSLPTPNYQLHTARYRLPTGDFFLDFPIDNDIHRNSRYRYYRGIF